MPLEINISNTSSVPKYMQLVNEIIRHIAAGNLQIGDKIPSIHDICNTEDIARDTVITAYNELKERGIIAPKHGKGFYIASTAIKSKLKIFTLFDVMNGYKEVLYRSFVKSLGEHYQVDIFFHYYNLRIFKQLISENLGKYGYYVIMPHFNENVSEAVRKIPPEKLLIIDKPIDALEGDYCAVYQRFRDDVYASLHSALPRIRKYNRFTMISNRNFQFIPEDMEAGFLDFCKSFGLPHRIIPNIHTGSPEIGDLYLVVSDEDLFELIRTCMKKNWVLGKDIGIISYDETPLKSILAGGIAVISTDFAKMGQTASGMIKGRITGKMGNPCQLILRPSL